jgi:hypothetical protein
VLDKNPKDKVFDFSVEPINYIDFIGVDAILSNYSNQNCDEIYMAEKTFFLSKSEGVIASSLEILMACVKGNVQGKHGKPTWQGDVWVLHDNYQGILTMKIITFIMGCCLVLILRSGE